MPTGTTRIRLRPANSSRLSFGVQVSLALFAIAYAVLMLRNSPADQDFYWLSYVFLALCVIYLGFILVHNAPVFGTQSYFEFAPGYLVHKAGLFRAKQVFAAENMSMLELLPRQLRVRLKDGDIHVLNMREVKGTRRLAVLRALLENFATRYGVALREDAPATK
ncbi:hypothetical protein E4631_16115 [Hymenobacter sp. UV11]|uniref:hypothetical protein n=1 Tax=Hymenobacter sp. UV11 TaxID=1849735 RepID=UPI00105CD64E|nr:hypothetical protein [Hymenobacter sp. UV11]TDN37859.1 hypothetical protein A8B98_00950 [Hymenobacter sp. UV11]TFZ65070.1 hypothetical protein E4631_16115 [Hymenobacter sp. UV11]